MAKILVVDDRVENRSLLAKLLGYGGHEIVEASDGAEALAQAQAQPLDLIISDILMPTMDGFELVRRLRSATTLTGTPVVFYTATYLLSQVSDLAHACGVRHIIEKPTRPEEVLRIVEEALGASPPAQGFPSAEEFHQKHLRVVTERLSAQKEQISTRLEALVQFNVELSSERNPELLLENFCRAAREIIGARYALAGVTAPGAAPGRTVFASGMGPELALQIAMRLTCQGLLDQLLAGRSCLSLLTPDGATPALDFPPEHAPVSSILGAPVASPMRVYGWLCLMDKLGSHSFSREDERLAGILAAQAGRTYENSCLYADAQRHAERLKQEVQERRRAQELQTALLAVSGALAESATLGDAAPRILKTIGASLGWDFGSIWSLDRSAGVLRCVEAWHSNDGDFAAFEAGSRQSAFAPGVGMPGRILATGKPVWIPDVSQDPNFPRASAAAQDHLRAGFGFPIGLKEVHGVIEFFSRAVRQPDDEMLDMLTGVGRQIGQFIERREAEETLRNRVSQAALSADVGMALTRTDSLAEMLKACAEAMVRNLDAAFARIWTLNATDNVLEMQASAGCYTHTNGPHGRVPVGSLKIGRIAQDKKPHLTNDVCNDARISDREWAKREGMVSFAGYPLVVEDQLVGVMAMFARRRLAETSLETMAAVANQIALGIERRRAEAALRESEEKVRLLLDSTAEAIYGLDLHGNCTFCNQACARLLGYRSPEELLGKNMHVLMHHTRPDGTPYPREECHIYEAFVRGTASHVDSEVLWRSDGRSFPAEYWSYPVRRDGEVVGTVVTFLDITERRSLEDQFRQAQKMEAIGKLAGGVAHDFNNLLTIIDGYSEMIAESLRQGDPLLELIVEVRKAGERATALTRQLLAFSRKQVLVPAVLDLHELVRDMEKMLRRLIGEDIDLLLRSDPSLWPVKVDPGQVEQVVMNLVVNARDAMPQGGKITIDIQNVRLDETYVSSHPESRIGPHVMLAVSDTGCGMDKQTMARIFEPFFTTKGPEKGTGLGLATVYGIVKQSGGHVHVYSEPGLGSTLKVYLPRDSETKASGKSLLGLAPVRRGTETILFVEDEDSVRALGKLVLQKHGYKVLEARHGGEALLLCEQHQAEIDLMVTDVVMPNMSGRVLSERLRNVRPGLKVLYLSGYTDDAIVRHGVLEAGTPFLQKPFGSEGLARKVREVLDQPETQ